MAQRQAKRATAAAETSDSDELWIGEHAVDGDILVLDPDTAEADGRLVSYYSLSQLRWRAFPARFAEEKIRKVTDEIRVARARKDYGRRSELEAEQGRAQVEARADLAERQREQVIRLHEKYMEQLGIPYEGAVESPEGRRSRRSKCHACGIGLDDFVNRVCGVCAEVLCSCGACACGSKSRSR